MKPDIDALQKQLEEVDIRNEQFTITIEATPFMREYLFNCIKQHPALLAYIDDLQAVADGARYMVKSQNGGYLEFHLHYGEALKQTEKALAKLDGEP